MNSLLRTVLYMEDLITHVIRSRILSKCESVPQQSWNINLLIQLQSTVSCSKLCYFQLPNVHHKANELDMQNKNCENSSVRELTLNYKINNKVKAVPLFLLCHLQWPIICY